jgi:hypothetical protein
VNLDYVWGLGEGGDELAADVSAIFELWGRSGSHCRNSARKLDK